MHGKFTALLIAVSTAVTPAFAACSGTNGSGALYAQCGGMNWTGATSCVAGAVCTYSNPYYSQCVPCPAGGTTPSATTTTPPATTSVPPATTSVPPSTTTSPPSSGSSANKFWFVFGDSYTQTQFNYTSTQPSLSNPFGNPPYPGFTACGSVPNWIDYDTVTYNATAHLVYNFAYGGATINATLVAPYQSTVLSLIDQVNQFLAGYQKSTAATPWTGANSLFATWIGINDIGNSYYASGNRTQFSTTLLTNYFAEMSKLYAVGARNFLFLNVPPVDRSPLMLGQDASAQALEKSVINDFNSQLATFAKNFASSNAGTKTWVYDTNTEINNLLNNPTANGFVDNTSYGSATNDFWCNNYHIGPGVHNFVAQGVRTTLAGSGFM